jgi:hypothetical protein
VRGSRLPSQRHSRRECGECGSSETHPQKSLVNQRQVSLMSSPPVRLRNEGFRYSLKLLGQLTHSPDSPGQIRLSGVIPGIVVTPDGVPLFSRAGFRFFRPSSPQRPPKSPVRLWTSRPALPPRKRGGPERASFAATPKASTGTKRATERPPDGHAIGITPMACRRRSQRAARPSTGRAERSGPPTRCARCRFPPPLFPARAGESGGATTTRPRPC